MAGLRFLRVRSGKSVDFATKVIEQGTADPQKACDTGKVAVSAAVKVADG